MSKKNKKKLVLNTETLRNLQDSQLRHVGGGELIAAAQGDHCSITSTQRSRS